MTWKELCEKAQELGYFTGDNGIDLCYGIRLWKCGDVSGICDNCGGSYDIAKNRTPDQMYQIMLALRD